jgi:hypothetical protein
MTQPSFVISHLHMPIVMLQVQHAMPFIMQQKLHMPPAIMEQRFCIMAHAAASSHTQVAFMPPLVFSILKVQRGTIIMLGIMAGAAVPPIIGLPPMPVIPPMPFIVRSIIIVPVMLRPFRKPCGGSDLKRKKPEIRYSWTLLIPGISTKSPDSVAFHQSRG